MSELSESSALPSDSATQSLSTQTLRPLARDRANLSSGLLVSGVLIGLAAVVQSSTSLPWGIWAALGLLATGTALSVPWSSARLLTGLGLLRSRLRARPSEAVSASAADGVNSTRTGVVVQSIPHIRFGPPLPDLSRLAVWREPWDRARRRVRSVSRIALLLAGALSVTWLLMPFAVLQYGLAALIIVACASTALSLFGGPQAVFVRSRAAITSTRGLILAASLLLLAVGAWQNLPFRSTSATANIGQTSSTGASAVGATAAPLIAASTPAIAGSPATSTGSSAQSSAPATVPAVTATYWAWWPKSIDLNVLALLGILLLLVARRVGVSTLVAQIRAQLLRLSQTPGRAALGLVAVFLAFSVWQQPRSIALPTKAPQGTERDVLQLTIEQKADQLKQLTQQLAPGEAHAAVAAGQVSSTQVIELARLEKELADARYRLATLNSAGTAFGTTPDDSVDLTYWGRSAPAGGSTAAGKEPIATAAPAGGPALATPASAAR